MNAKKSALTLAIGSAFAVSLTAVPTAQAENNPFAMQQLQSGYLVADNHMGQDAKAKEGKCGGKTEADMKAKEGKCGNTAKMKDGKCGEGKCGAKGKGDGTKAEAGKTSSEKPAK